MGGWCKVGRLGITPVAQITFLSAPFPNRTCGFHRIRPFGGLCLILRITSPVMDVHVAHPGDQEGIAFPRRQGCRAGGRAYPVRGGIRTNINYNLSERLQGTFRDRIKVLGGLDGIKTGQRYLDGWGLTYDHFRGRGSLGNKTPGARA